MMTNGNAAGLKDMSPADATLMLEDIAELLEKNWQDTTGFNEEMRDWKGAAEPAELLEQYAALSLASELLGVPGILVHTITTARAMAVLEEVRENVLVEDLRRGKRDAAERLQALDIALDALRRSVR
jgi:hypothetical protein